MDSKMWFALGMLAGLILCRIMEAITGHSCSGAKISR
jgi:hypothetical protein